MIPIPKVGFDSPAWTRVGLADREPLEVLPRGEERERDPNRAVHRELSSRQVDRRRAEPRRPPSCLRSQRRSCSDRAFTGAHVLHRVRRRRRRSQTSAAPATRAYLISSAPGSSRTWGSGRPAARSSGPHNGMRSRSRGGRSRRCARQRRGRRLGRARFEGSCGLLATGTGAGGTDRRARANMKRMSRPVWSMRVLSARPGPSLHWKRVRRPDLRSGAALRSLSLRPARVDHATRPRGDRAERVLRGVEAEVRDDESSVAWMFRTLRNAIVDHYRRQARPDARSVMAADRPRCRLSLRWDDRAQARYVRPSRSRQARSTPEIPERVGCRGSSCSRRSQRRPDHHEQCGPSHGARKQLSDAVMTTCKSCAKHRLCGLRLSLAMSHAVVRHAETMPNRSQDRLDPVWWMVNPTTAKTSSTTTAHRTFCNPVQSEVRGRPGEVPRTRRWRRSRRRRRRAPVPRVRWIRDRPDRSRRVPEMRNGARAKELTADAGPDRAAVDFQRRLIVCALLTLPLFVLDERDDGRG